MTVHFVGIITFVFVSIALLQQHILFVDVYDCGCVVLCKYLSESGSKNTSGRIDG